MERKPRRISKRSQAEIAAMLDGRLSPVPRVPRKPEPNVPDLRKLNLGWLKALFVLFALVGLVLSGLGEHLLLHAAHEACGHRSRSGRARRAAAEDMDGWED